MTELTFKGNRRAVSEPGMLSLQAGEYLDVLPDYGIACRLTVKRSR